MTFALDDLRNKRMPCWRGEILFDLKMRIGQCNAGRALGAVAI